MAPTPADTEEGFEQLFSRYFRRLHGYAFFLTNSNSMAEECVQEVFVRLWEKGNWLKVHDSMQSYLYTAVYHECLQQMKKYKRTITSTIPEKSENNDRVLMTELEKHYRQALLDLPEQCRLVFLLNRQEGMKYREIAAALSLSIKTVEIQMSKALKRLRSALSDHLPTIIFLLWMNY